MSRIRIARSQYPRRQGGFWNPAYKGHHSYLSLKLSLPNPNSLHFRQIFFLRSFLVPPIFSFASGSMTGSNRKSVPLPLSSLNHISRNCKNVQASINFYCNLLGFVQIRRPGALNFNGAWLYNYGIGIHLLHCEDETLRKDEIDVRADHISFQSEDIDMVEKLLREAGIKYERRVVEEEGIEVEQLFFHDPDGFMIEICTCDKLPVEPLGASVCVSKLYAPPFNQVKTKINRTP